MRRATHVDIRRFILRAIKRFLLPELEELEKQLDVMRSRQEEILAVLGRMQSEIMQLRERVSGVEARYESFEETMLLRLENMSLKARLLKMLGGKK